MLSFHGATLVGGGQVFRLATPGGTTFLLAVPRGRTPNLDGILDDPTPDAMARVLARNEGLEWVRIGPDGTAVWHPEESAGRLALPGGGWVVCYGVNGVPDWLSGLGEHARPALVQRMAAAAGLDLVTADLSTTSVLQAGPSDGGTWTAGRHLLVGLQAAWAWSTTSWQRAALAAGVFALALTTFGLVATAFRPPLWARPGPSPTGSRRPLRACRPSRSTPAACWRRAVARPRPRSASRPWTRGWSTRTCGTWSAPPPGRSGPISRRSTC